MATEDWCRCWSNKWQFDHMADGHGYCKWCELPIAFFFINRKGGQR